MSTNIKEIRAKEKSVYDVLNNAKYTVEDFQREYKWERKHIEQLIVDFESSFFSNYKENHEREEIENYNAYFLGPIVISTKGGKNSIIDGQQRLTSLTLLLIYLNNLQKEREKKVPEYEPVKLDGLIYSEKYGKKSFNISIPEREKCLNQLYNGNGFDASYSDDESVKNIADRYSDIEELFPEGLKEEALPYFIDWLQYKVIFVEITASSDENAYTIFETMNDRGLNLSPTEMLKGYLLSKVKDSDARKEINEIWKKRIAELHKYDKDADLDFFKAWLRAKYAESIRPGRKGAANEDFEKIGTRFHTWVKENLGRLGLKTQNDFCMFVEKEFDFYSKLYTKILDASVELENGLEHLFYITIRGIAYSLLDPLLMAPIKSTDDEKTINKKLALVGRFVETFTVFRSVNYRTLAQSSIRYTMYSLVKEIRNKDVEELASILKEKIKSSDEDLDAIQDFGFHLSGKNKKFVHFLLARITHHIEQQSGIASNFKKYMNYDSEKFEIEHLWANKFENHKEEIKQRDEFEWFRNLIGGLILLPKGTNQSFKDASYEVKLPHYLKENLLAQTLHPKCYEKNPNFLKYKNKSGLPFKPHKNFKLDDLLERQTLYQKICEEIWDIKGFDDIVNS
jgi:uncharacterized protein with ParB-like and HNH nuclease domain